MITFSIIQKSQLEGAHRLDAEYYSTNVSFTIPFLLGKDAVEFVQYGTSKELNENLVGYPVLRLNEFNNYFVGNPAKYCDKISKKNFEDLKLNKGDILVCRTNGNPRLVGKAALVMQDENFAFASYLFRIKPKKDFINSSSLTIFLNSKYGRQQIEKYLMPSIQSNFSPAKFREIKIPFLEKDLQKNLEISLLTSWEQLERSKKFYVQAERLLLNGLGDFQTENKLYTIINLS